MGVKGFIFDMDGVLTETSEMHYLAWKQMADKIGILIDRKFNEKLKGISRRDSIDLILGISDREFSEEVIQTLMAEKNENYVNMISSFSRANLCPGIIELLDVLKEKDIKIAVASASKSAGMLIKLLEIDGYVDYIVDPGTVKSKPDPEIFLKAALGINLEADLCIGIEDAAAGVASIKAANMCAIGIGDSHVLEEADLIFESTDRINFEDMIDAYNRM